MTDESTSIYRIHTNEEEAYDIIQILKQIPKDNKWIRRIKTDNKGVIV
jgi:hypothetical protein